MEGTRVAYLVKRFPRLSETFVLAEFLELRRQGVDVVLYALMDPLESVSQPAAAALAGEVTYLHDAHRRRASWARLLWGAAAQAVARPGAAARVLWSVVTPHRSLAGARHAIEGLWLARDLRRCGVTHLHAHFAHSPASVAHMTRRAGGPPFSFTAHAKDIYTTLPRNLRLRIRAAEFVVTCTEFNASHLRTLSPSSVTPLHVVHHGIDVGRFTVAERQPVSGAILSVGRLVEKKGYDDVLTAVARLHASGITIRWDVYGSGPLRTTLAERARRLGVGEVVTFHGAREQREIIAAYHRASVFALAPVVLDNGDRDGIPNVLVEAMACGLPVVTTAISGIPELITDAVDGLLVAPHDPASLSRAMARLLGDEQLAAQLGCAARQTVERSFDAEANTRRLVDLFVGGDRSRTTWRARSGIEARNRAA